MIQLAHLSDLHLGSLVRDPDPKVDPAAAPMAAVTRMMERVLQGNKDTGKRYDAVLIAGDVFDRRASDQRPEKLFSRFLGDLHDAGIPVAMITGNHDAEVGLLPEVKLPKSARLLGLDGPETLIWDELGLAVHGQSIIDPNEPRDLVPGYPQPIKGLTNVGMLHTSLDGSYGKRPCAPTTVERLERHGYHYWALGHVHKRRILDDQGRVVYCGSPSSRNAEEDTPRGYMSVGLKKKRVRLSPINSINDHKDHVKD